MPLTNPLFSLYVSEMPVEGVAVKVERSTPEPVVKATKIVRPWEMSPTKRRTPSPQTDHRPVTNITPPGYSMMYMPAPYMASTPLTAGATYATFHSPPGVNTQQNDSGYHSNSTVSVSSPESSTEDRHSRSSSSSRRQLSQHAVLLMEQWYQSNFDHPYPSDQVVEYIATVGNLTKTQVKKWMANKRVRSFNTLSFNGSVHPRKMKRMQRIQQYKDRYSAMSTSPRVSPYSLPVRSKDSHQLQHPLSLSVDNVVLPMAALPTSFVLPHGLSWTGSFASSR